MTTSGSVAARRRRVEAAEKSVQTTALVESTMAPGWTGMAEALDAILLRLKKVRDKAMRQLKLI
jgi:hypothetical protein